VASAALSAPRARPARKPPSALTERRLSLICEKIAAGVPQTTAAVSSGVPRRTYQEWLAKGREPGAQEPYASMAERVEAALASYHESLIVSLEDAVAEADPRTKANVRMWGLERRFRDDWAAPEKAGSVMNVQVVLNSERQDLAARLLQAAQQVLGDDPDKLEALMTAVAGGEVVEGEAAEAPAELGP